MTIVKTIVVNRNSVLTATMFDDVRQSLQRAHDLGLLTRDPLSKLSDYGVRAAAELALIHYRLEKDFIASTELYDNILSGLKGDRIRKLVKFAFMDVEFPPGLSSSAWIDMMVSGVNIASASQFLAGKTVSDIAHMLSEYTFRHYVGLDACHKEFRVKQRMRSEHQRLLKAEAERKKQNAYSQEALESEARMAGFADVGSYKVHRLQAEKAEREKTASVKIGEFVRNLLSTATAAPKQKRKEFSLYVTDEAGVLHLVNTEALRLHLVAADAA